MNARTLTVGFCMGCLDDRCVCRGRTSVRGAALHQQLYFPSRRFASPGAGRTRASRLYSDRHHRRMFRRRCRAGPYGGEGQEDEAPRRLGVPSRMRPALLRWPSTGKVTDGCAGSSVAAAARRRRGVTRYPPGPDRVADLEHVLFCGFPAVRRRRSRRSGCATVWTESALPWSCFVKAPTAAPHTLQDLGRELQIPLVASGDVHMHSRDAADCRTRSPRSVWCPVAEAGWHLYPNGERYLREPERLAKSLSARVALGDRCHRVVYVFSRRIAIRVSPRARAGGAHTDELLAQAHGRGCPLALAGGRAGRSTSRSRKSWI